MVIKAHHHPLRICWWIHRRMLKLRARAEATRA